MKFKALGVALATTLIFSGCSSTDDDVPIDPDATKVATQAENPPDNEENRTDEEYQAALDRIRASEELDKQLQQNNITENKPQEDSDGGGSTPVAPDAKPSSAAEEVSADDPISLAAFDQVSKWNDKSAFAPLDSVVASPNISEELRIRTVEALSLAYSMWDEVIGVPKDYKVFLFTPADGQWAEDQLAGYRIGRAGYSSWTTYAEVACSKYPAGASSPTAFVACFPPGSKQYTDNIGATVVHEYFHSVQRMLDGGGNKSTAWMDEGTADFVEVVIKSNPVAKAAFCGTQGSDFFLKTYGFFRISELATHWTVEELTEVYDSLSLNTGDLGHLQVYCMGTLAARYLFANFGTDAVIGYYREIGSGASWTTAFQRQFGLTTADFYAELHSYLRDLYG